MTSFFEYRQCKDDPQLKVLVMVKDYEKEKKEQVNKISCPWQICG